jgi:outer membrane protein assembly factor BamA
MRITLWRAAVLLILAVFAPACATTRPPGTTAAPPAPETTRPQDTAPVVRTIEIVGASVFPRETILKFVRLREGARLRRDPQEVAHTLQERYRIQGYLGAAVAATFDSGSGVLTLTVDEGRLAEVTLLGVEGRTAESALAHLALPLGVVLREKDVRAALARLEDRSAGALSRAAGTPYSVERTPSALRLQIALVQRRSRLTFWPDGPDPSPLSNRVEGFAPGVGANLTLFDPVTFNHADLYGRVSYGMSSETTRYAVGARRPFGADQAFILGAEAHDLTDTDDLFRRSGVTQARGRVLTFSITEDYFRRKGYEAYAFARPGPRLHLGLSYRHDDYQSLPVERDDRVFFFRRNPRVNPAIDEGRMHSVVVTARLAGRDELFDGWKDEREAFLVRNPYGSRYERAQRFRLEGTFETTVGGDYSFRRAIGHARGTRDLGTRHSVSARLLLGVTGGTPPLQRRFALGGAGTLRGYAVKEFAGEHMVLGTVEWAYSPLSRFPGIVAFYDGGATFSRGPRDSGWRDDVGIGLEWPGGGRAYVRVDVALPLQRSPGADRARVHASLRLPF